MRWHLRNLTAGTSLPKAFASLAAYPFDAQGTRHLDYVGLDAATVQGDGLIHELYLDASGLHSNQIGGGGSSSADQFTSVAGYTFAQSPTTQHVVYRTGSPGAVIELWWDGDWHTQPVSEKVGAPEALAGPYGFAFGELQAICYRAADSHPIVLWWSGGSWQPFVDLTALGSGIAMGEVVGYAEPAATPGGEAIAHVVWVGTGRSLETGTLHHAFRDATGTWQDDSVDLPQIEVLTGVRPAGLVDQAGIHHVFCAAPAPAGSGGAALLHEFSRNLAGTWSQSAITTPGFDGPDAGATLSAYEFPAQGTIHVPYPSDHGEFYDSWWSDHLGWSIQVLGVGTGAPPPVQGATGYVSTQQVRSQPVTHQYLDYRDAARDAVELSWSPLETVDPQLGDVDGDGNLDVIAFGDAGVWVARSDGHGNFHDPFLAVDNLGYDQSWRVDRHPRFAADLTGERRADIVGFGDAGVWTAMSRQDGTIAPAGYVMPDFGYQQGWRVDRHVRLLADLDRDGGADIVGFGDAGVYTARSALNGGFTSSQGTLVVPDLGYDQGWRVAKHPRLAASLRGPGATDLVGFGDAGVYVALGNDHGGFSFTPQVAIADFGYEAGGWRVEKHPRFVAHLTRSGYGDIVGFGDAGVWTALGNGDGTFQPPRLVLPDFGYVAGGWRVEKHPRFLADVDGDGLDDIVGFGDAGVYVALSDGHGGFQQSSAVLALGDLGYDQGWRVGANPRFVVDLDHDGRADLLGFDRVGLRLAASLVQPPLLRFSAAWMAGPDFGYVPRDW